MKPILAVEESMLLGDLYRFFAVGLGFLVLMLAPAIITQPAIAKSYVSLLVDGADGQVLKGDRPNALWYPASLTKLMTVYVAFEALRSGRLHLEDKVAVTANAAGQKPNRFGLRSGQRISVEQAILATIVVSGNDAAVVLAEAIAGSEDKFANLMTETARRIGMTRSHFLNASGLPHDAQVTTAHDMAVLALHLLKDFPQFYHYFGTRTVTIGNRTQSSVNGILGSYPGADGMKTGFTCGSGYNLVASAERDGRRLIGVVLGGRNRGERAAAMTELLNDGFRTQKISGQGLAELAARISPEETGPPPMLLDRGECDRSIAESGNSIVTSAARISGWGIVFGAFAERTKASKTIAAMKEKLKGTVRRGRSAIIQRTWEGITRYSALLVGLGQEEAGEACKKLWAENAYCLVLNPIVLANPDAEWR